MSRPFAHRCATRRRRGERPLRSPTARPVRGLERSPHRRRHAEAAEVLGASPGEPVATALAGVAREPAAVDREERGPRCVSDPLHGSESPPPPGVLRRACDGARAASARRGIVAVCHLDPRQCPEAAEEPAGPDGARGARCPSARRGRTRGRAPPRGARRLRARDGVQAPAAARRARGTPPGRRGQRGARGRHTVAPSSMSDWLKSPGRSRGDERPRRAARAGASRAGSALALDARTGARAPAPRSRPPRGPGRRRRCSPPRRPCRARTRAARAAPRATPAGLRAARGPPSRPRGGSGTRA